MYGSTVADIEVIPKWCDLAYYTYMRENFFKVGLENGRHKEIWLPDKNIRYISALDSRGPSLTELISEYGDALIAEATEYGQINHVPFVLIAVRRQFGKLVGRAYLYDIPKENTQNNRPTDSLNASFPLWRGYQNAF